jgi:hypothetical protein
LLVFIIYLYSNVKDVCRQQHIKSKNNEILVFDLRKIMCDSYPSCDGVFSSQLPESLFIGEFPVFREVSSTFFLATSPDVIFIVPDSPKSLQHPNRVVDT